MVTITGWGTDNIHNVDYWIIKNSWDTHWGEGGYIRLMRGINSRGINNFVIYPSFGETTRFGTNTMPYIKSTSITPKTTIPSTKHPDISDSGANCLLIVNFSMLTKLLLLFILTICNLNYLKNI